MPARHCDSRRWDAAVLLRAVLEVVQDQGGDTSEEARRAMRVVILNVDHDPYEGFQWIAEIEAKNGCTSIKGYGNSLERAVQALERELENE